MLRKTTLVHSPAIALCGCGKPDPVLDKLRRNPALGTNPALSSPFAVRNKTGLSTPLSPTRPLRLASASVIRLQLLRAAGLDVTAAPVRLDEAGLRDALLADGATPRDIADALAEMKARKLADREPTALVLGCDQVLAFKGAAWGKPDSADAARAQLTALRGQTHHLLSAVVIYDAGRPVWRHVGDVRLTMRQFSDSYLDAYLARNWPDLADTVGGYKLEAEGARLFDRIEGD